MLNQLIIKIQSHKLIFQGSIDHILVIPEDTDTININMSDGTKIMFSHAPAQDAWYLTHNRSRFDTPKYYEIIKRNEKFNGSNDSIEINYGVAYADVLFNDDDKSIFVGEKVLTADQNKVYVNLLNYLSERGFICVDEIKKDIRNIIIGN